MAAAADQLRHVTSFEARSLLVFALAATMVALFFVGQALARHVSSTVSDLEPLRAVGMTAEELSVGATLGPAVASVGGIALGVAIVRAVHGPQSRMKGQRPPVST